MHGDDQAAERHRRCRGAIVRDRQILLLKHQVRGTDHTYWWFPGGGREPGESDIECVVREIREETGLHVQVDQLLLEYHHGVWDHAIYFCTPLSGRILLGDEQGRIALIGFGWYSIENEGTWEPEFYEDYILPTMKAVRGVLLDRGAM